MAFTFSLNKESLKRKYSVYVVVAQGPDDTACAALQRAIVSLKSVDPTLVGWATQYLLHRTGASSRRKCRHNSRRRPRRCIIAEIRNRQR
jgi:hypothetical protein